MRARQVAMGWFDRWASAPLDFALPRRCAGCGDILERQGFFCASCWQQLHHLPDTGCTLCTTPMDLPGLICAPCLAAPPEHDGVLAAVAYGDVSRDLALRLKYGRKLGFARVMAQLMASRAAAFPEALLVPVPLHRWRLWSRGFNQALLIARAVGTQSGQGVAADMLRRKKRTAPLGHLTPNARRKEVAGAFALAADAQQQLSGRHVLLVDDVYTTGATANGCARVLKKAGAASVRVLCWARVLRDDA